MKKHRARLLLLAAAALATSAAAASAQASGSVLRFGAFAHTGLRLTGIVWTGQKFLFVDNTTNRVAVSGPSGAPLVPFATMPRQVEETRCRLSPGAHGFTAGAIFCHSPDNKIYRISPDGKAVTVFAVLPPNARSDGALTFDTVGRFGYALIAVTGRSGSPASNGGRAYAIDAAGHVRLIGSYRAPGGADEASIAPGGFGALGGSLLLAVDAGRSGSVVSIDPRGRAQILARLPDGPNPIVALVPGNTAPAGRARAGLYVVDTLSRGAFFAPAAELAPYRGDVLIGSELRGLFWVARPRGRGIAITRLPTTLTAAHYNLEDATYIAG